ncbi:SLOG family protein [Solibaculum mannosilyticum]|uniref:Putative SPBc2 prophage-derived protein YoqJ n=1 Tax=Solibaculum mannosilyticum TaxID=2780922 RepID=A0A7I8D411_9FIRM|nr:SLOG family protein [Solibaculum mannosilyticum]BCI59973.1 putative SPBc2 prophage-derived protein YoqJ [Solibaculum mannosilyticum]
MKNKTVVFIGHRACPGLTEHQLLLVIEKRIHEGYTHFLSGGMGQFDWLCARCVSSLKTRYPHLKNILIVPYVPFSIQEPSYFDEILYPVMLGQASFSSAIPKRNQYLVDHASLALCYVDHPWGGAAKTYQYARKKALKLINLGALSTDLP